MRYGTLSAFFGLFLHKKPRKRPVLQAVTSFFAGDVFEDEGLVENARVIGDYLMEGIRNIGSSHIKEVRGRGLMIGIELDMPHAMVRKPLIKHEHCFTGCAGQNILRLLPPHCLTKAEADDFIESQIRVKPEEI